MTADTAAIACLSVATFATCSIPVLLLADADHLTPACVRSTAHHTATAVRHLPLTGAALLMLLGGTK
ncbi:hypothetical protein ACFW9O_17585 [Streptomyces sp. NPDC059499]|uniref:hypothetical protein n=1 Tax=Streptomyces sp. NPDC059499 TaxID=3346852 RepID=UPI0036921700